VRPAVAPFVFSFDLPFTLPVARIRPHMKFTYNWLKQYVDFDWSPQQPAEKLTFRDFLNKRGCDVSLCL
jgi:hypothetical protein